MTIGILQPGYLPWLGFFEQLQKSDIFVLYDDVQYDKGSWRNRNRIKTAKGIQWLTIPVSVKFLEKPLIHEVKIDDSSHWRKKHLLALRFNYSKAQFFNECMGIFEDAYKKEWDYLVDIDKHFIIKIAEYLCIDTTKIRRSSQLKLKGDKIERLISLCKLFGADTFYEGYAGKNYIDEKIFAKEGIKVIYQEYQHPVYRQLYGEFVPYLSVVDLLFNCGPKSLEIIMNTFL
ncbi:MAG: WbqC family protein [Candidatus Omnitrophota bacterium]|nr:WbqC family protein [Candidatus Omnitrophota bacterium]